uniref:Microtubule-associated protein 9 n=1 Tax=Sander lucioperca TaxID=283035 RepID=A0A8D0A2G5_SANLU
MMSLQDELQAAVTARASKTKTDQYSYSDDFNDDEDVLSCHLLVIFFHITDFLNELLKSRKKRAGAFKAGKSKSKINDFEISDDEDKHGRTKRVSFLKTQRIVSPSGDTTASESRETEPTDSSTAQNNNYNDSFSSQHSTNVSEDNVRFKSSDVESTDPQITRESSSKSLSYQTSDDTLLDMPLPLSSDNSVMETPGPEEKSNSVLEESSQTPQLSATDLKHVSSAGLFTCSMEPPRPKPRQRTLGLSHHAAEKIAEDAESQDLSRPQTSSASIPLSTDMSSNIAVRSCGPHAGIIAWLFSIFELKHLIVACLLCRFTEVDRRRSRSFMQPQQILFKTSSSHSKTTQRSQSVCSGKVESKYLGSLKLLDRKVSLQESQPQAADTLRAAIYQEWLQKKKEKLKENMQRKKKEEILKEKKKMDEVAKKEDAVASYQAWKEKKAESLKAKAKEKQDMITKEQRAIEEKEEKKQSAKQVFEKWKLEHDQLLKEKFRKQREAESKLQFRKQKQEEEKKRDRKSAISEREKKKGVLHEKFTKEQEKIQNKAEEERYMKEERDKMALEMYENWLVRKDLEQKRRREERRIQAILHDSPPPPWSPPNKTIPFRK